MSRKSNIREERFSEPFQSNPNFHGNPQQMTDFYKIESQTRQKINQISAVNFGLKGDYHTNKQKLLNYKKDNLIVRKRITSSEVYVEQRNQEISENLPNISNIPNIRTGQQTIKFGPPVTVRHSQLQLLLIRIRQYEEKFSIMSKNQRIYVRQIESYKQRLNRLQSILYEKQSNLFRKNGTIFQLQQRLRSLTPMVPNVSLQKIQCKSCVQYVKQISSLTRQITQLTIQLNTKTQKLNLLQLKSNTSQSKLQKQPIEIRGQYQIQIQEYQKKLRNYQTQNNQYRQKLQYQNNQMYWEQQYNKMMTQNLQLSAELDNLRESARARVNQLSQKNETLIHEISVYRQQSRPESNLSKPESNLSKAQHQGSLVSQSPSHSSIQEYQKSIQLLQEQINELRQNLQQRQTDIKKQSLYQNDKIKHQYQQAINQLNFQMTTTSEQIQKLANIISNWEFRYSQLQQSYLTLFSEKQNLKQLTFHLSSEIQQFKAKQIEKSSKLEQSQKPSVKLDKLIQQLNQKEIANYQEKINMLEIERVQQINTQISLQSQVLEFKSKYEETYRCLVQAQDYIDKIQENMRQLQQRIQTQQESSENINLIALQQRLQNLHRQYIKLQQFYQLSQQNLSISSKSLLQRQNLIRQLQQKLSESNNSDHIIYELRQKIQSIVDQLDLKIQMAQDLYLKNVQGSKIIAQQNQRIVILQNQKIVAQQNKKIASDQTQRMLAEHRNIIQCQNRIIEIQNELKILQGKLTFSQASLYNAQKHIKQLEDNITYLKNQGTGALKSAEQTIKSLQKIIISFETEKYQATAHLKNANIDIQRLQSSNIDLQKQIQDNVALKTAQQHIQKLQLTIVRLEQEINISSLSLIANKQKINQLQIIIEGLKRQTHGYSFSIKSSQEHILNLQALIIELKQKNKDNSQQLLIRSLKQRIQQLQKQSKQLLEVQISRHTIQQLNQTIRHLTQKLKIADQQINQLYLNQDEIKQTQQELNHSKNKYQQTYKSLIKAEEYILESEHRAINLESVVLNLEQQLSQKQAQTSHLKNNIEKFELEQQQLNVFYPSQIARLNLKSIILESEVHRLNISTKQLCKLQTQLDNKRAESNIYILSLTSKQNQIESLKQSVSATKDQLSRYLSKQQQQMSKSLKQTRREQQQMTRIVQFTQTQDYQRMMQQLKDFENRIGELTQQRDKFNQHLVNAENYIFQFEQKNYQQLLQSYTTELKSLQNQKLQLKNKQTQLQTKLIERETQLQKQLIQRQKQLQTKLIKRAQEIAQKQKQTTLIQSQDRQREFQKSREQVKELKQRIEILQGQIRELEQKNIILQKQLSQLQKQLSLSQISSTQQITSYKNIINEIQTKRQNLLISVKSIQTKLESNQPLTNSRVDKNRFNQFVQENQRIIQKLKNAESYIAQLQLKCEDYLIHIQRLTQNNSEFFNLPSRKTLTDEFNSDNTPMKKIRDESQVIQISSPNFEFSFKQTAHQHIQALRRIEQLNNLIEHLRKENQDYLNHIRALQNDNQNFLRQILVLKDNIATLSQFENKYQIIINETSAFDGQKRQFQRLIVRLQSDKTKAQHNLKLLSDQLASKNNQLLIVQHDWQFIQHDLTVIKSENERLLKQLLKPKLTQLKPQIMQDQNLIQQLKYQHSHQIEKSTKLIQDLKYENQILNDSIRQIVNSNTHIIQNNFLVSNKNQKLQKQLKQITQKLFQKDQQLKITFAKVIQLQSFKNLSYRQNQQVGQKDQRFIQRSQQFDAKERQSALLLEQKQIQIKSIASQFSIMIGYLKNAQEYIFANQPKFIQAQKQVQILNQQLLNQKNQTQSLNQQIINQQILNQKILNQQNQVQFLKKKVEDQQNQIQFLNQKLLDQQKHVQSINQQNIDQQNEVQFLNKKVLNQQIQIQFLNKKNIDQQDVIRNLQQTLNLQAKKLSELNQGLQSKLLQSQNAYKVLQRDFIQLEVKNNQQTQRLQLSKKQLQQLQQKLTKKQQVKQLETEKKLQKIQNNSILLSQALLSAKLIQNQLQMALQTTGQQNNNLKQYISNNRVFQRQSNELIIKIKSLQDQLTKLLNSNNHLKFTNDQLQLNINELNKVLESEYMNQIQITTKLNTDIISLKQQLSKLKKQRQIQTDNYIKSKRSCQQLYDFARQRQQQLAESHNKLAQIQISYQVSQRDLIQLEVKYHELLIKYEEKEKQLKSSEQNLTKVQRKKSAQSQVAFKQIENKQIQYAYEFSRAKMNLNNLQQSYRALQQQNNNFKQQIYQLRSNQRFSELSSRLAYSQDQRSKIMIFNINLQEELKGLLMQLNALKNESILSKQKQMQFKDKQNVLSNELYQARENINTLQQIIKFSEQKNNNLKQDYDNLKQNNKELEINSGLMSQNMAKLSFLQEERSRLISFNSQLHQKIHQYEKHENKQKQLLTFMTQLQLKFDQSENNLTVTQRDLVQLQTKYKQLHQSYEFTQKQLKSAQQKITTIENNKSVQSQNAFKQIESKQIGYVYQLYQTKTTLINSQQVLQSVEQQNRYLKSLLQSGGSQKKILSDKLLEAQAYIAQITQLNEFHAKQLINHQTKFAELEKLFESQQRKLRHLQQQSNKYKDNLDAQKQYSNQLNDQNLELTHKLVQAQSHIYQLKSDLSKLKHYQVNQIKNIQSKENILKQEINELKNQLQTKSNQLKQNNMIKNQIVKDLDIKKTQNLQLHQQIHQLQNKVSITQFVIRQQVINEVKKRQEQIIIESTTLKVQCTALKEQCTTLKQQSKDLKDQWTTMRDQCTTLRDQSFALKDQKKKIQKKLFQIQTQVGSQQLINRKICHQLQVTIARINEERHILLEQKDQFLKLKDDLTRQSQINNQRIKQLVDQLNTKTYELTAKYSLQDTESVKKLQQLSNTVQNLQSSNCTQANQLKTKDQTISSLSQMLKSLAENNEKFHSQLQVRAYKIAQLQQKNVHLSVQLSKTYNQLEQTTYRYKQLTQSQTNSIRNLQQLNKELEKKVNQSTLQITQQGSLNNDYKKLTQSLNNITGSLQQKSEIISSLQLSLRNQRAKILEYEKDKEFFENKLFQAEQYIAQTQKDKAELIRKGVQLKKELDILMLKRIQEVSEPDRQDQDHSVNQSMDKDLQFNQSSIMGASNIRQEHQLKNKQLTTTIQNQHLTIASQNASINQYENEIQAIQNQLRRLSEQIQTRQKIITQRNSNIDTLTKKISQLETHNTDLQDTVQTLKKQLEKALSELNVLTVHNDKIMHAFIQSSDQIDKMVIQRAQQEKSSAERISLMQVQFNKQRQILIKSMSQVSNLKVQNHELQQNQKKIAKQKIDLISKEIEKHKKLNFQLIQANNLKNKELNDLHDKIKQLNNQINQLNKKFQGQNNKLQELNKLNNKVQQLQTQRNNQNQVIKKLKVNGENLVIMQLKMKQAEQNILKLQTQKQIQHNIVNQLTNSQNSLQNNNKQLKHQLQQAEEKIASLNGLIEELRKDTLSQNNKDQQINDLLQQVVQLQSQIHTLKSKQNTFTIQIKEKQNELKLESQKFKQQIGQLKQQIKQFNKEIGQFKLEVGQLKQKNKQLLSSNKIKQQQLNQLAIKYQAKNQQITKQLTKKLHSYENIINSLQRQNNSINNQLQSSKNEVQLLNNQIQKSKIQIQSSNNQIQLSKTKILSLSDQLQSFNDQIGSLNDLKNSFNNQIKLLSDLIKQLNDQIKSQKDLTEQLKNKIITLEYQIKILEDQNLLLKDQIQAQKKSYSQSNNQSNNLIQIKSIEMENLTKSLNRLNKDLVEKQSKIQEIQSVLFKNESKNQQSNELLNKKVLQLSKKIQQSDAFKIKQIQQYRQKYLQSESLKKKLLQAQTKLLKLEQSQHNQDNLNSSQSQQISHLSNDLQQLQSKLVKKEQELSASNNQLLIIRQKLDEVYLKVDQMEAQQINKSIRSQENAYQLSFFNDRLKQADQETLQEKLKNKQLQSQLQQYQSQSHQLKKALQKLSIQYNKLETWNLQIKQQSVQKQNKYNDLIDQIERISNDSEKIHKQLEDQIKQLNNKVHDKQQIIQKLQDQIRVNKDVLQFNKFQLQKYQLSIKKLNAQIQTKEQQVQESKQSFLAQILQLNDQIMALKYQISKLQRNNQQKQVVSAQIENFVKLINKLKSYVEQSESIDTYLQQNYQKDLLANQHFSALYQTIKYKLRLLNALDMQKQVKLNEKQAELDILKTLLKQGQINQREMSIKLEQATIIQTRYDEVLQQLVELEGQNKALEDQISLLNNQLSIHKSQMQEFQSKLQNQSSSLSKSSIQGFNRGDEGINRGEEVINRGDQSGQYENKQFLVDERLREQNLKLRRQLQAAEYQLHKYKHNTSSSFKNSPGSSPIATKRMLAQNNNAQAYQMFIQQCMSHIQFVENNVADIQTDLLMNRQNIQKLLVSQASQRIGLGSKRSEDSCLMEKIQQLQEKLLINQQRLKQHQQTSQIQLITLMRQTLLAKATQQQRSSQNNENADFDRQKVEKYLEQLQELIVKKQIQHEQQLQKLKIVIQRRERNQMKSALHDDQSPIKRRQIRQLSQQNTQYEKAKFNQDDLLTEINGLTNHIQLYHQQAQRRKEKYKKTIQQLLNDIQDLRKQYKKLVEMAPQNLNTQNGTKVQNKMSQLISKAKLMIEQQGSDVEQEKSDYLNQDDFIVSNNYVQYIKSKKSSEMGESSGQERIQGVKNNKQFVHDLRSIAEEFQNKENSQMAQTLNNRILNFSNNISKQQILSKPCLQYILSNRDLDKDQIQMLKTKLTELKDKETKDKLELLRANQQKLNQFLSKNKNIHKGQKEDDHSISFTLDNVFNVIAGSLSKDQIIKLLEQNNQVLQQRVNELMGLDKSSSQNSIFRNSSSKSLGSQELLSLINQIKCRFYPQPTPLSQQIYHHLIRILSSNDNSQFLSIIQSLYKYISQLENDYSLTLRQKEEMYLKHTERMRQVLGEEIKDEQSEQEMEEYYRKVLLMEQGQLTQYQDPLEEAIEQEIMKHIHHHQHDNQSQDQQ